MVFVLAPNAVKLQTRIIIFQSAIPMDVNVVEKKFISMTQVEETEPKDEIYRLYARIATSVTKAWEARKETDILAEAKEISGMKSDLASLDRIVKAKLKEMEKEVASH